MVLTHQEKLEAIKRELSCTISGLAFLLNQHRCTLGQKILNKLTFVGLDKIYIDYLYRKIVDKVTSDKLDDIKISGICYDIIDKRLVDFHKKHGSRKRRASNDLAINSSFWLYIPNSILKNMGVINCDYASMWLYDDKQTMYIQIEFIKNHVKSKDSKKIYRKLYNKSKGKKLFIRKILRNITENPKLNHSKLRVSLPFSVAVNDDQKEEGIAMFANQQFNRNTLLIKLVDILQ